MAQDVLKVKHFYPRGPFVWHLQPQGRDNGLPSNLHPQRWHTEAFSVDVLDFAAGFSTKG
jgi:hypothetical protein